VHEYASGLTSTSKAEFFCSCKRRQFIGQNKIKMCKLQSQNYTFLGQKIGCPSYNALLFKGSCLASVTPAKLQAMHVQVISSKTMLCPALNNAWKHVLFLRQPTTLEGACFSCRHHVISFSTNKPCSTAKALWHSLFKFAAFAIHLVAFLSQLSLLTSCVFKISSSIWRLSGYCWLTFEVVQCTRLFGGHICLYRILLPDNTNYCDVIN